MTQPYKGVRDFYPEDQRVQSHIFSAMRHAVESFGYEEMNASVLEPTELYRAKTSEEIVNEQTYTFTDRGDRSVTLRPEMTPTVARMVAAKKRELGFPLRWYSIQNFFRYERQQRGRLREFWQLNADIFGISDIEADAEIVILAHRIMQELGATEKDFEIRINDRKGGLKDLTLNAARDKEIRRLFDKKNKMLEKDFKEEARAILGDVTNLVFEETQNTKEILERFHKKGIKNVRFDGELQRGFDYYTGMVFEVFDTNAENKRSLFGGGRYDNLIERYGGEPTPAVGFAMGDVVTRDFLETHGLLPKLPPSARLYLAPVSPDDAEGASRLANTLREKGINVSLGMKHTKVADHIKAAVKLGIPYFAAYGADEASSNTLKIKKLATGEEKQVPLSDVHGFLKLEAGS